MKLLYFILLLLLISCAKEPVVDTIGILDTVKPTKDLTAYCQNGNFLIYWYDSANTWHDTLYYGSDTFRTKLYVPLNTPIYICMTTDPYRPDTLGFQLGCLKVISTYKIEAIFKFSQ